MKVANKEEENVENEENSLENKEENVENEKYPNNNWILCIDFLFKIASLIPTGNMAFITIIKPDYVNPITLISCVMHEEDRVEKLL